MTVSEIINRYNTERPNQVEDSIKVDMLKRCEHGVLNDVVEMYDDADELLEEFGLDYELIVPEPYDDIYIYYLDQRIAMNNNDLIRYNRVMTEYNNAMVSYQQYFSRTTRPKKATKHMIRHEVL